MEWFERFKGTLTTFQGNAFNVPLDYSLRFKGLLSAFQGNTFYGTPTENRTRIYSLGESCSIH